MIAILHRYIMLDSIPRANQYWAVRTKWEAWMGFDGVIKKISRTHEYQDMLTSFNLDPLPHPPRP